MNVIPTSTSSKVSGPIIADPRLRKLSFTGSTEVGRTLMQQAAQGILRTSMELGGNAPFVIFEDADLDKAVDGAMIAKFRNIGQACTAANRFIVHESVADEFAKRVADRVQGHEGRPRHRGRREHRPAHRREGRRLHRRRSCRTRSTAAPPCSPAAPASTATARSTRRPCSRAWRRAAACSREEIFGPVLGITTFADEDEAVRLANGTEYGLVSYVFTQDLARGHRMIDRLATGMMGLNTGLVSNAAAPFGGVKQSGIGREGGLEGIHEYLDTKYTLIPVS